MQVEIKITIKATEEHFDEREIKYDIKRGFAEMTGYEIEEIEIEADEN